MLVGTRSRPFTSWAAFVAEYVQIGDDNLRGIDRILDDDMFGDIVWRAFTRASSRSTHKGRPSTAIDCTLRTGVLKHFKNWSFRELFKEIQPNLDYRRFTRFFADKTPNVATMARSIARIDAQALREMNEHLAVIALERGIIKGRVYRQDTTVCETNVHYPTDSSLLADGVRVLQRLTESAAQLLPSPGTFRDRSRSVRRHTIDIARSARSRGDDAKERRKVSYRKLLRIVRPVVTTATKMATRLGKRCTKKRLSFHDALVADAIKDELDTMTLRVDKVIQQTRARICRGVTTYPNKLLSLFVPMTCVIRKGKPHKPNEFGCLIDIIEVENGFVSDYGVLDGNPPDGDLLIPGIERHKQRFGRAPHLVATDAGFWSAKNERDAHKAGVKRVSIPYKGKLSAMRRRIQRSRWFRKGQRWRANGEGRIGILKNVYGLNRCMYKSNNAMARWLGWCVFVNNLVIVARTIRTQEDNHETTSTTQRQDARRAA